MQTLLRDNIQTHTMPQYFDNNNNTNKKNYKLIIVIHQSNE